MDPHGQASGEERDAEDEQRHREEAGACGQRAVAEVVLDVERQVQEHGEDRRGQAEGHRREPDERRDLEQAEVQHRVCDVMLVDEEGHHEDGRAGQQADRRGAAPAEVVPPHQREHEQEQAHRERDEADPVDPARSQVFGLGDLRERDEHGDDADGHVDEEDPAPTDAAGDGAPDQRPDGDGTADHGAVDAEGRPAIAPGERGGDQGQRGGEHDGAPDALHGTRQVEHERGGRQSADERGGREDDQPDGEDLAPPVDVADDARGEQEGGESQRVRVDDPLQVGEARVERLLNVGQRHVDDRDVEQEHERRRADGDQGPPFSVESGHSRSVSTWRSPSYNVA